METAVTESNVSSLPVENAMRPHYPQPTGYRMLIKPLVRESVSAGGIVLADETQQNEDMLNTVGQVLAMGNECYGHEDRVNGAWCRVGSWVVYRRHAGTVCNVRNPQDGTSEKLVFVADDEILATTMTPESVVAYLG